MLSNRARRISSHKHLHRLLKERMIFSPWHRNPWSACSVVLATAHIQFHPTDSRPSAEGEPHCSNVSSSPDLSSLLSPSPFPPTPTPSTALSCWAPMRSPRLEVQQQELAFSPSAVIC